MKTTKPSILKVSFFLGALFVLSSPYLFALSLDPETGRIQQKVKGTKGKTFILIEEAHVNYGAQKAIAAILEKLLPAEKIKLILVEGGWGDVSLSSLRRYGNREGRRGIAEGFLKEGKISGEEYLNVSSDLPMELWGIEDASLYADNMNAFLTLEEKSTALENPVQALQKIFELLREKMLSAELARLLKRKEALRAEKISLLDYLHVLKGLAGPDAFKAYPALQKMEVLGGKESDVNEEKAHLEREQLTGLLSKTLTRPEFEELQLLDTHKNPEGELQTIKALLRAYRKLPDAQKTLPVESLKAYRRMLKQSLAMDSSALFQQIETMEETLYARLSETPQEKEFLRQWLAFLKIKSLFELKLTPKDFEKISASEHLSDFSALKSSLETLLEQSGLNGQVPDLGLLEKLFPAAQSFYQSAQKREKALIENSIQKMEKSGEKKAVLIAGGFHSKRIFDTLHQAGYSVIRISPRFEIKDAEAQHRQYLQILKYKWEGAVLPDGKTVRLNAPDAFALKN